ncbi:6999_t:CDS:2 [Rhizophagus irregularis]|nr:6999_t:CDS:2 [Rhizophagus irregularis]
MGVSKSIVNETNVPLNIALKQITQLYVGYNHKLAIRGGSEVLIVNGKEALQLDNLKIVEI